MLDINSKRIYIEQTPVNEKDYTEDGESSEDEHSIRSENGNIDVFSIESNKLFHCFYFDHKILCKIHLFFSWNIKILEILLPNNKNLTLDTQLLDVDVEAAKRIYINNINKIYR